MLRKLKYLYLWCLLVHLIFNYSSRQALLSSTKLRIERIIARSVACGLEQTDLCLLNAQFNLSIFYFVYSPIVNETRGVVHWILSFILTTFWSTSRRSFIPIFDYSALKMECSTCTAIYFRPYCLLEQSQIYEFCPRQKFCF